MARSTPPTAPQTTPGSLPSTPGSPPSAPVAAPRRGRPRDAGRDRALLEATLAVLAESGYGGLTTAAVAARAGVSTATLYRRWSSKEELVIAAAAVHTPTDTDTPPGTGTLAGDLRVVLHDKATTVTGESGRLMRALIGEAAHNTALAEALATAFLAPVYRRVTAVVHLAVERGEIPPVEDADLLGEVLLGPIMTRFFLTPQSPAEVDAATARHTADRLLPFLLRALGGTVPPDA
ncbi:TetR/AcrR family transcriptional regulator [Kitasatospora sp. NPDC049285]|uniref:TetR/AcrR family transcriptional regulator n=1 Tax=Kitasatospora sp. NPDC049285 TaxID=3157096 RepID=UPI003423D0B9